MEIFGAILLSIIGLFILYVVIFVAVKDGIDKSVVGQLIIRKHGIKEGIVPVSDEEIEKILEDDFNEEK